jgi:acyl carrier protein
LAALDRVLGVEEAETTVVRADWARLAALFRARGTGSLFARLAPTADERPDGARTPLRATLQGLSAEARRTHLVRHLATDLATILGFDAASRPDPQRGFFDLGMDSLTAIELKDRLSAALGTPLSPTIAFDYPSIEALADHLLGALDLTDGSAETAGAAVREPSRDDAGQNPQQQATPAEGLDALLESRLERLESLMEARP